VGAQSLRHDDGVLGRFGRAARWHGDAEPREEHLRLVLVDLHLLSDGGALLTPEPPIRAPGGDSDWPAAMVEFSMQKDRPERRLMIEREGLLPPREVRLALFDASTERIEKRATGVQTLLFRDWTREDLYDRTRND